MESIDRFDQWMKSVQVKPATEAERIWAWLAWQAAEKEEKIEQSK